ncbi:MAG: biotin/lipoyl-binding protein [Candidatus Sumerlaeota bacterium]|nr:biotin/lipoyl-binding protein [Candidatus Sumerlaeota bacterium]
MAEDKKIVMPKLTGAPQEGRVLEWFCEEGQTVREGDEVLCVATATNDIRVPAPCAGVIKEILVDEGDEVRTGDILALLE